MNTAEYTKETIQILIYKLEGASNSLDKFGVSEHLAELISDFSCCIGSIQNGCGNIERSENENAEEVLAELRETFGYDRLCNLIIYLHHTIRFEQEVDETIRELKRLLN